MSDEQLCLLAQQGDENALNNLLTKYKPLASKLARSYFLTGGDIEDLVQEGMIGLYKAIKHFTGDKNASFRTFATTCIKHQLQSAVRVDLSEKNKILSTALSIAGDKKEDDEDDEDFEILIPSTQPSPYDKIIEKESLDEMKEKIIKTLSKLEINVLALYLKGYSYNEISLKSGLSKKSIDNALSRIKNKLSFLKDENKNRNNK